jgi:hypothetical protein
LWMSVNVVYFIDTMTTRLPPILHVWGCGSGVIPSVAATVALVVALSWDMDAGLPGLDGRVASHDVVEVGSAVVVGGLAGAGCTGVVAANACSMGPAVVDRATV